MSFQLVLSFIEQNKLKSLGIIFLGFFTNIFTILINVSIGKYYELVFGYNSKRSQVLNMFPDNWTNTVVSFLIFFAVLIVFRFLFFFLYKNVFRTQGEIFIKSIKDKLFEHQLAIEYDIYHTQGTDKYLLRYSGDINSLKNLYLKGSISVVVDILILIVAFFVLYKLNSQGAFVVFLGSLVSYFLVYFFNKKIEFYSILKRNESSGQLGFVNRTLKSILSIASFGKRASELKKFSKRTEKVKGHAEKFIFWDAINRGFVNFVQFFVLLFVLYLFHKNSLDSGQQISGGELIGFILLYITIIPIIRRVYGLATVYKMGFISLNKLHDILDLPIENEIEGAQLKVNKPRLVLQDFSIGNSPFINFISVKGEIGVLQIPSDVKIIELIKAFLRIEDNYKGEILINKHNIKEYSKQSVRKSMALISSQLPLIGRRVKEAISYSSRRVNAEKALPLLNRIQDEFKVSNKMELNDFIGSNGSQLDALQIEILALARGLLSERKLLIIDRLPILSNINRAGLNKLLNETGHVVVFLERESQTSSDFLIYEFD